MKLSIVSASVLLAAMSVSAYAYTPGTYTAAIAGQNGPVKVEVTTSADKILSVKIVDQKETEGIGSKAVSALPPQSLKLSLQMFRASPELLSLPPLLRRLFRNA